MNLLSDLHKDARRVWQSALREKSQINAGRRSHPFNDVDKKGDNVSSYSRCIIRKRSADVFRCADRVDECEASSKDHPSLDDSSYLKEAKEQIQYESGESTSTHILCKSLFLQLLV